MTTYNENIQEHSEDVVEHHHQLDKQEEFYERPSVKIKRLEQLETARSTAFARSKVGNKFLTENADRLKAGESLKSLWDFKHSTKLIANGLREVPFTPPNGLGISYDDFRDECVKNQQGKASSLESDYDSEDGRLERERLRYEKNIDIPEFKKDKARLRNYVAEKLNNS